MKWPALLCLMGCAPFAEGEPSLEASTQTISGGSFDGTDRGIVFVRQKESTRRCTGSLISRNLVLTARHCVSNFRSRDVEGVVCGNTSFEGPLTASDVDIALGADGDQPTAIVSAREVWVLAGDGGYCDHDAALLLLARPITREEAAPLEPRVGMPARKGEVYSAVGFGASDDSGAGFGVRQRLDTLLVTCVGAACGVPDVGMREWQGPGAICRGDSGGPALDVDGRIMGVASRAAARCEAPIYTNVSELGPWLRESGTRAADILGEAAPVWTHLSSLRAFAPSVSNQGCGTAGGVHGAVLLAVGFLRRQRRWRRMRRTT